MKSTELEKESLNQSNEKDFHFLSKPKKKKKEEEKEITNPIWLSVSEAAKLGGVQNKTIRRAIQSKTVKFKIIKNRYQIDLKSLIIYLHSNKKLNNKLLKNGLGQYVDKYNLIEKDLKETET